MSNMSYCRFENTNRGVADCANTLGGAVEDGIGMAEFRNGLSSSEERASLESLKRYCEEFIEAYTALEAKPAPAGPDRLAMVR